MPALEPRVACNLAERAGAVKGREALGAAGFRSCQSEPDRYTGVMNGSGKNREGAGRPEFLYFFPDQKVTADEVRHLLRQGTGEQRAWVISHLLRYAQWDDIWTYVSREEVKEVFPTLDLPENLRQAWGRMLKVEAPVA
jgi:hypothetical protein